MTSRSLLPLLALLCACHTEGGSPPPATTLTTPLGSVAPRASSQGKFDDAGAPSARSAEHPSSLRELIASLSEPDGPFFSDNVISNETSYLQVAPALTRTGARGGAYIGVGPEQNFTYIALTRPKVAFIVDIRRQNMVEHLLYRAIFQEARSRSHFLALLLGRPWTEAGDPAASGSIEEVIAHVERAKPDEASFAAAEARLRALVDAEAPLDATDAKAFEVAHRTFFRGQLETHFELKPSQGRRYPSLREVLAERDPDGVAQGFLASESSFRFVQEMEREGRVIPVVGDFAGDRAMPGIARYLAKEGLHVSAFYTSNVEQYLLEPKIWARWTRNVAAMPTDDASVFIRAYLDQGRRHPLQMRGHRTATVLQRVKDFEDRQATKGYTSFWELTTG